MQDESNDMRHEYSKWLELQAKKDHKSAKKLLEQPDEDIGNILFLFEQSYEKILKSVYVYCECVVFKKNFNELIENTWELTRRHESVSELIQTILPKLLKNYKKTAEILDEKLAKNISNDKFSVTQMVDLIGLISISPKYAELRKFQKQIEDAGEKMTDLKKEKDTNQQVGSYQVWLEFLNQLRFDKFKIENYFTKFNEGYKPYEAKIEKNLNNAIGFKEKIENATMFLSFATTLSPLSLAYRYSRYPVKEAKFKNLKSFFKINNYDLKKGLETMGHMIEYMIQHGDDFNSLILGHKKIQQKSQRWKKREERIAQKKQG